MKKLCLILIISALFVFAGCGNGTDDFYDYGDSQSDNTDSDKTDSDNTDSDNTDSDKTDSDNTDSDKTDSDNTDSDNTDSDKTDSDNPDTDNPDTDNPDTDNPDTDNPDTDNPDTDNPDTDNPDTDNPDTDNPDTDNPDTDNPDTDNPDTDDPGIVCTGISLNASTFSPYYEGYYYGVVSGGLMTVEFYDNIAVASYDLSTEANSNYATCTECLLVIENYGSENAKNFFQESGEIVVSAYDPDTFGMTATITATLVETTIDGNGNSTPVENGACLQIETGVVSAEDHSGKTETCADIYNCFDTCAEDDANCPSNCYGNSTAIARSQYNALSNCGEEHNCNGSYYCFYENCLEQEEICGMKNDEEYDIPYGQVTINGTFTYLHAESETSINITDHAIHGPFVTGTFGNGETKMNVIDPTADQTKIISYAKIAPFKDVPTEKNITLIQTYQEDGKTPTVHFVTTVTEPGEYTLGLGEWTTEARIFVSETNSEGERSCDHAFGVGTVTISAISWDTGTTEISVSGTATLYSYKAAPHYGGDISGTEWVACEPK